MISYYDVLKASKGLYVADTYAMMWGRQISSDGQIYEITSAPPLTFISNGDSLKDYRIYGNTIQNGEPSPENPVDVVGCGEFDAISKKYQIPVEVTNGVDTVTTIINIGSEPLHRIGDYADYVDFKRGVVVRRIKKLVLNGGGVLGVELKPYYSCL